MKDDRKYWSIVGTILFAIAVISARIYHPGELVEFSDTIYPIRPDLTMAHWMSWWWPGNLGTLWTNVCWLPHLVIPWVFWRLGIDPGAGQALQYFVWLAVPVVALAFCIAGLAKEKLTPLAALPLFVVPFNLYVVLSWTSSVAMYAIGSEALFAWALVEGIERQRPARGLLIVAAASLWMSADVANPPYFAIVAIQTIAFALWMLARNRARIVPAAAFCGIALVASVLVGIRWIVPTVMEYAHYPLTKLATGGAHAYDWVTARATLLNALRFTPMWYWGDPTYTYYAAIYQGRPFFVLGSFAPFLFVLLALQRAISRRLTGALLLFGLSFLWMFLVKSDNEPFVRFSYGVQHLPLMFLFRDSEKFLGPFVVDVAVACGIAIAAGRMGRVWTAGLAATALFAAVAGGWLLFTGEAFTAARGTPPLSVRVPAEYYRLATEAAARGATRLAVSPYDTEYQIGTNWGFFGADTEFFDDLPGVPLVHAPYVGYVSHAHYDDAWKAYSGFARDDVGRQAIERDLSIDGALLRNDLMPYVGFAPPAWRFEEFGPDGIRGKTLSLATGRRSTLAREYGSVLAETSGEYNRTMFDLVRLGVSVPLLDAGAGANGETAVLRVGKLGGGLVRAALLRPEELGNGIVNTAAGTYDVVVRAGQSKAFRRDVSASAPAPSVAGVEPVFGLPSGSIRRKSDADPAGAVFHYQTEGAFWARTVLQLPVLGPHRLACGDVAIDGRSVARLPVREGRQLLAVPAVVPPGSFKVTVWFDAFRGCSGGSSAPPPLWTSGMAPPSVTGVAQRRAPVASLFARTYRISMPLSADPTLVFWWQGPVGEEDAFAVAHVSGDGCKTQLLVRNGDRVIDRFDDIGRRPVLGAACREASSRKLAIDAVDVVVKASNAAAQHPDRFALIPARPALNWQLPEVPRAAMAGGGVRVWSLPAKAMRVGDFPVLGIAAPSACFDFMTASFTFGNPPRSIPVFHIREFYAGRTGNRAMIPIGDDARAFGAVSSDAIRSIEVSSVAPASMRKACPLQGLNVAADAETADPAWIAFDGRRISVPRDDRPHTYAITLAKGAHRFSTGGPIGAALLLPHAAMREPTPLPASTQGAEIAIDRPGWITYAQASDAIWHASLDDVPLDQHRANIDVQAYFAAHPGKLRIALPFARLQPIAELVTWATLLAIVVVGVRRWRFE